MKTGDIQRGALYSTSDWARHMKNNADAKVTLPCNLSNKHSRCIVSNGLHGDENVNLTIRLNESGSGYQFEVWTGMVKGIVVLQSDAAPSFAELNRYFQLALDEQCKDFPMDGSAATRPAGENPIQTMLSRVQHELNPHIADYQQPVASTAGGPASDHRRGFSTPGSSTALGAALPQDTRTKLMEMAQTGRE